MSLTHRCMLGNCSSHGHTDSTPCRQSLVGMDTAQSPRHSCCQQIPQWPSHRHMLKLTQKVGHQNQITQIKIIHFLYQEKNAINPANFKKADLRVHSGKL